MIVMMGHVMTDITLNIGKSMLPDGVHGEATKRTLSRYDDVVRGHLRHLCGNGIRQSQAAAWLNVLVKVNAAE